MATVTETIWVWRIQADKEATDKTVTFERFMKKETFVDGDSVGVVDMPSDTKTIAADDLWTP